MKSTPLILVGKKVAVRASSPEPAYYTDVHRSVAGSEGVVHAIVPAQPRENPLVKVKFDGETRVIFFRLSDLDVLTDAQPSSPQPHGKRASHLP